MQPAGLVVGREGAHHVALPITSKLAGIVSRLVSHLHPAGCPTAHVAAVTRCGAASPAALGHQAPQGSLSGRRRGPVRCPMRPSAPRGHALLTTTVNCLLWAGTPPADCPAAPPVATAAAVAPSHRRRRRRTHMPMARSLNGWFRCGPCDAGHWQRIGQAACAGAQGLPTHTGPPGFWGLSFLAIARSAGCGVGLSQRRWGGGGVQARREEAGGAAGP